MKRVGIDHPIERRQQKLIRKHRELHRKVPQVIERHVAVGEPRGVCVPGHDRMAHELPFDRLLEHLEIFACHRFSSMVPLRSSYMVPQADPTEVASGFLRWRPALAGPLWNPAEGIFLVFDRGRLSGELEWTERVDHHRQFVGARLANRPLVRSRMRTVRDSVGMHRQRRRLRRLAAT